MGPDTQALMRWRQQPMIQQAYIRNGIAQTWHGARLGKVISEKPGGHRYGIIVRHIRVAGTNGAIYWGRYDAAGIGSVFLRKYKYRNGVQLNGRKTT